MGGKCICCGYNRCIQALELHHLNPEEKEISLSNYSIGWDKVVKELEKCILVCSNCHREIHEGFYTKDELFLKKIYLDDIANELINDRNSKLEEKHYYCPSCGKEITRMAQYCSDCANKNKRIVKERPTREELKQLIRTTPFTKIGQQFEVSDNAIRKWCKAENLPSRANEIKKYTNEEWELI